MGKPEYKSNLTEEQEIEYLTQEGQSFKEAEEKVNSRDRFVNTLVQSIIVW